MLQSHSPQGECGLKLVKLVDSLVCSQSLPARGVWIEISWPWNRQRQASRHSPQGECGLKLIEIEATARKDGSHSPQGECGLKYDPLRHHGGDVESLPARGVWIEMDTAFVHLLTPDVTPRKGSVD